MKNLKPKPSFQIILGTSLSINVLSVIIIFFMAYKYYQITKASKNNQNNIITDKDHRSYQNEDKDRSQTLGKDTRVERSQSQIERLKLTFAQQLQQRDVIIIALQKKLEHFNKNNSQNHQVQDSLKQELELQQERSRFLEQKSAKLQRQLVLYRESQQNPPSFKLKAVQKTLTQSQVILHLRNQLQFCQKRLSVSQNTEKELRLKLQSYQKIGQYSLSHPQYIRMRQMNTRYKQIIANLQSYLLQKNHNNPILNISFNDF